MSGAILAGGAQIAHQQLLATEDIQGQETVAVVVTMKETPLLVAVHRIIGGIEVENQLAGWFPVRSDELFYQHPVQGHRCLAVHAVFQPAQGGLAGQHLAPFHGRLNRRIPSSSWWSLRSS